MNNGLNEIYEKYKKDGSCDRGTDKGSSHSYVDIYDSILASYVGKEPVLMELGISSGNSVLMWQEFLKNGIIHGADICSKPKIIEGTPVIFHRVDLGDKEAISREFENLQFDIIIDDASHKVEHQVLDASILLPKLKKGGIYVIEDIQGENYIKEFWKFGAIEIIDLRKIKGRYDDLMVVIRR